MATTVAITIKTTITLTAPIMEAEKQVRQQPVPKAGLMDQEKKGVLLMFLRRLKITARRDKTQKTSPIEVTVRKMQNGAIKKSQREPVYTMQEVGMLLEKDQVQATLPTKAMTHPVLTEMQVEEQIQGRSITTVLPEIASLPDHSIVVAETAVVVRDLPAVAPVAVLLPEEVAGSS